MVGKMSKSRYQEILTWDIRLILMIGSSHMWKQIGPLRLDSEQRIYCWYHLIWTHICHPHRQMKIRIFFILRNLWSCLCQPPADDKAVLLSPVEDDIWNSVKLQICTLKLEFLKNTFFYLNGSLMSIMTKCFHAQDWRHFEGIPSIAS